MKPSRKWWAATITGAGALTIATIQAGNLTTTITITTIGFTVERAVAWLTPNDPAAG